jgi:hypothetical protein
MVAALCGLEAAPSSESNRRNNGPTQEPITCEFLTIAYRTACSEQAPPLVSCHAVCDTMMAGNERDNNAVGTEHGVPPPVAMMGLITGYWISQAVGAVATLGVADRLANGARTCDELAREVGAYPQALYRVLRLLASIGVFVQAVPRSFGLTALGETLRSDPPGSVRNFAITETAPGHWQPWGRLEESIRTGQPMAGAALGMELFEWYAQNPGRPASSTRRWATRSGGRHRR